MFVSSSVDGDVHQTQPLTSPPIQLLSPGGPSLLFDYGGHSHPSSAAPIYGYQQQRAVVPPPPYYYHHYQQPQQPPPSHQQSLFYSPAQSSDAAAHGVFSAPTPPMGMHHIQYGVQQQPVSQHAATSADHCGYSFSAYYPPSLYQSTPSHNSWNTTSPTGSYRSAMSSGTLTTGAYPSSVDVSAPPPIPPASALFSGVPSAFQTAPGFFRQNVTLHEDQNLETVLSLTVAVKPKLPSISIPTQSAVSSHMAPNNMMHSVLLSPIEQNSNALPLHVPLLQTATTSEKETWTASDMKLEKTPSALMSTEQFLDQLFKEEELVTHPSVVIKTENTYSEVTSEQEPLRPENTTTTTSIKEMCETAKARPKRKYCRKRPKNSSTTVAAEYSTSTLPHMDDIKREELTTSVFTKLPAVERKKRGRKKKTAAAAALTLPPDPDVLPEPLLDFDLADPCDPFSIVTINTDSTAAKTGAAVVRPSLTQRPSAPQTTSSLEEEDDDEDAAKWQRGYKNPNILEMRKSAPSFHKTLAEVRKKYPKEGNEQMRISCHLCQAKLMFKGSSMLQHVYKHAPERLFPCPDCEFSGLFSFMVIQHIRDKHPNSDPYKFIDLRPKYDTQLADLCQQCYG